MPSYMAPILKAKESGISFRKMSNDELLLSAYSLIVKMNVITGWAILDKKLLDVFAEQLSLKLSETYSFLNQNEIEYAFRNYSVNDWGKNFNLNALDEVLKPYLTLRRELHINELKAEILLPIASKEISQKEMMQEVEEYLNREKLDLNFLPGYLYEYAEKLGLVKYSKKEKLSILEEAKNQRRNLLANYAKTNKIDDIIAFNQFCNMVKVDELDETEKLRVKELAKKIAFKKYYEKNRPA
jgi:hypothetical protein